MRAVLHKDRVKARIVRHDRKNRPEGRVTEILERSSNPIVSCFGRYLKIFLQARLLPTDGAGI